MCRSEFKDGSFDYVVVARTLFGFDGEIFKGGSKIFGCGLWSAFVSDSAEVFGTAASDALVVGSAFPSADGVLMAGAVVSSNKIIASLVYLALLCGTDAG